MVVDKRLYQFAAVQFVVTIRVVHFKIMELQLLFAHLARVNRYLGMLRDVSRRSREGISTRFSE